MASGHEKQKPKKIERLHFKVEEDVAVESEEFLNQFLALLRRESDFNPDELVFSGINGARFKKNRKMPPYKGIFAMNLAGWVNTFTDVVHHDNPAVYAERWEILGVPTIGLFDKNQLIEAYNHKPQAHGPNLKDANPEREMQFNPEGELGKISLSGETIAGWGRPTDTGSDLYDTYQHEADDRPFLETEEPEYVEEPDDFEVVELGDPLSAIPNSHPISEGVAHVNYPNGSLAEALVGIVYIERVPIKHS